MHENACMTVALQIRDVPDDIRDQIAAQAERLGQSVQAYLLDLVRREARMLGNAAAFERTRSRRVLLDEQEDPVHVIREGRDSGFAVDRARPSPDRSRRQRVGQGAGRCGAAATPRVRS